MSKCQKADNGIPPWGSGRPAAVSPFYPEKLQRAADRDNTDEEEVEEELLNQRSHCHVDPRGQALSGQPGWTRGSHPVLLIADPQPCFFL